MDIDLEDLLLKSFNEGLFNRTILFVIADHGHRMDVFRRTKQGRIEDFLPMVSMVLPPWLAKAHPHLVNNLNLNSKRLASSYDLYSTFVDIFMRTSFKGQPSADYNFAKPKYGQSLFQPLPLERTCEDAGIPEQFCSCDEMNLVSLTKEEQITIDSVRILLDYINFEVLNAESLLWKKSVEQYQKVLQSRGNSTSETITLEPLSRCATLRLNTVERADKVEKPDGRILVHLTFRTLPNDGVYEGRVEWTKNGLARVHEDLERANRYGTQADCLDKSLLIIVPFVRSACYCQ